MRSTVIRRRDFLAGLGAALVVRPAFASSAGFFAARGDESGNYFLARFAADGSIAYDVALPARGHGIAVAPDRTLAVAVARRPGRFLIAFDSTSGAVRQQIAAQDDCTFCGHALFSADGKRLYTTETLEEDGTGQLGVYDVRDGFQRVAAWPTQGDDPHELLMVGDEIVVANGGIGPEGPAMMETSLVRLDRRDGRVLAQARPPAELRQVSLRHMAIADGAVYVAGQYGGSSQDRPALVARWDGRELAYLDLPRSTLDGLANYCGSIAASRDGKRLCITSPHGGHAIVFDTAGTVLARVAIPDVCGAVAAGDDFLLTGGRGDVQRLPANAVRAAARWDNHITVL